MNLGRRVRLALILGSLSAFGALTIGMYLPAMPSMAHQLHTSAPLVRMTLTAFVIGLALFQVIVGPLSDAWGRRRPLLAGMALYLAGSLWCALAPAVGYLIAGRILQSLGAAAGTVLARAIVRDLFSGTAMTRSFSPHGRQRHRPGRSARHRRPTPEAHHLARGVPGARRRRRCPAAGGRLRAARVAAGRQAGAGSPARDAADLPDAGHRPP